MNKILKIVDEIIIEEDGKRIAMYVFNDDTVVRVDTNSDEILTKDVSEIYLNLISMFALSSVTTKNSIKNKKVVSISEKKELIMSGKGAGWGVLCGVIVNVISVLLGSLTMNKIGFVLVSEIIPLITAFLAPGFLEKVSDKNYLIRENNIWWINFRKGFYPAVVFNLIVATFCCNQWKIDILSVLNGKPNKNSESKHTCFVIWEVILYFAVPIISVIMCIVNYLHN